jgi:ABC-type amino acid transport system permease subunit
MSFEQIIRITLKYWPMFLRGAGTTLLISITGTIIGFFIGLLVGIIRSVPIPESGVKKTNFEMHQCHLKCLCGSISWDTYDCSGHGNLLRLRTGIRS